ncbi:MAG: N-acetyl sugar amidotransferase [Armatimonadetes bacterium]|nr:N-acetyl sugar amidotransferase [Armatimonadota bacterium]
MKYCQRCVTPHSRPNIRFDESGRCNCATSDDKDRIDWDARERLFREVVENARRRGKGWDCVIPVSGGKDSTWQVLKCLEYGLKPLAVTWRPPGRTALGQRNLDNLIGLGVDHLDFSINPSVEKRFTWLALERHGAPAVPMHMALFSIPLNVAVKYDIPLVVWGENSAFEYGGEDDARRGFALDEAWLRTYGVTQGTTWRDWIGEELSERDMTPYMWPSDGELKARGILAIFLGYYFRWDPSTTYAVARAHGFRERAEGARTGFYNYADVDDDFISIHHWLKWYKFGFTRTFDNLSLEIRNGRMTRDEALRVLRERGDETPHADIDKFCAWLGVSRERFFEVCEKFRNPEVWSRRNGHWEIDNFIVPEWSWS